MRIGRPRDSSEQVDAMQLLVGYGNTSSADEVADLLSLLRRGGIELDGLIGAWEGTTPLAAGLLMVAPDSTAHLWPVEVVSNYPNRDAIANAVTRQLTSLSDRAGCPFTQSLTDCDRLDHQRVLEQNGFCHLADLLQLENQLQPEQSRNPLKSVELIITFEEQLRERFAATIEQTYINSQDCPEFMGVRTAFDAIKSYQHVGEFSPDHWWLVECHGRDAATILVNEWPDVTSREIVYLGVIPEFRGRGLGRRLVTTALAAAARDGIQSISVSVDSKNKAALKLYEQCGFVAKAKKAVFIRRRGGQQRHD